LIGIHSCLVIVVRGFFGPKRGYSDQVRLNL
jgi:hypothetical protein